MLLLSNGVLPVTAAVSTTVVGLEHTTERAFCGSCHVMQRHTFDAELRDGQSLAARHARNPLFGKRNCYVCHADYGMLGYPMTKITGMKHVWHYYFGGYSSMTLDEALPKLQLYKPYDNTNCRQCHSGTLAHFRSIPDHTALAKELEQNRVSCASSGCHGFAHPFKKDGKKVTDPRAAPSPSDAGAPP
jgi:cytochrome c-type protein NapC